MNLKKSTRTTPSPCVEILIIPSGFDENAVHECVVESGTSLTSEKIFEELIELLKVKRTQKEYMGSIRDFILAKSQEESLDSYLEYYETIAELTLRAMCVIIYYLENNRFYERDRAKYKFFKLLPSSDLVISTEPLCLKKN